MLDPWAGHALFEAARKIAGSKELVSLGAKAKLQQVMMTVAQKVPFELVALDGPAAPILAKGAREGGRILPMHCAGSA